jgi:Peptidase family S41
LEEVLPILQARYPNFAGLDYKPGDSLDLLLHRSQGEISIVPDQSVPSATSPILITSLPDGMIYCRFASFHPAPDFGSQLGAEINSGAQGIIIDLRSTSTPDDFAGAAQVANFFLPLGTRLFSIKDAQQTSRAFVCTNPVTPIHLGTLPITVLINNRTSGAAEALATCLKSNGALTIGRGTAGNGALFESHPLSSGLVLHYVAGDVTMADGTSLWRHSISPDIGLLVDPAKEEAVLGLITQGKILDVIRESTGSHRLSEAALVQGQDPAVDAYLIPADKHATAPQDSSLVTALDSLKAIRLSQRTTGAASATEDEPKIPSTAQ